MRKLLTEVLIEDMQVRVDVSGPADRRRSVHNALDSCSSCFCAESIRVPGVPGSGNSGHNPQRKLGNNRKMIVFRAASKRTNSAKGMEAAADGLWHHDIVQTSWPMQRA